MPDFGKGVVAANGLFAILDSKDEEEREEPAEII